MLVLLGTSKIYILQYGETNWKIIYIFSKKLGIILKNSVMITFLYRLKGVTLAIEESTLNISSINESHSYFNITNLGKFNAQTEYRREC